MFKPIAFRTKLILLGLFTTATTASVGAISTYYGNQIESYYRFILEKTSPKSRIVDELLVNHLRVHLNLEKLSHDGRSEVQWDNAIKEARLAIEQFEESNQRYEKLGFIDGQKEHYQKMLDSWKSFKLIASKALELAKAKDPESRKNIGDLANQASEKAAHFNEAANELLNFHDKILQTKSLGAEQTSASSKFTTWLFIGLASVFALLISLFVSFNSSNQLQSVAEKLIVDVSEVSGTVSDLGSSAAALARATSTQSSSIQETAASVEEIRSMVGRNSDMTTESARLFQKSKEYVDSGQMAVKEMTTAMLEITESIKSIHDEVETSNKRISEIVNIISAIESKTNIINDIVFQTKLLSFNASVEAARAGEHGKGFAVVAEEVGNLANMSGKAAKEISELLNNSIEKVQNIVEESTSRVRTLFEQSEKKLQHGNEVARDCGQALENIVSNTDELTRRVDSVATASKEQSVGVDEIAKAVQLLEHSSHVNVTETANTSASSEHLGNQVKSLNQAIYSLQLFVTNKANASGTIVNAFVWRDRYALGVPDMDGEHKILIEKINNLVSGINEGLTLSNLKPYFADLAGYTKEHFSDEEKFMASIAYPQLATHKVIHRNLLEKVSAFGARFDDGSLDTSELVAFLNDWLIKHILGVDMQYASYHKTGSAGESIDDAA
ncbi:MAG: bacteriohemerythrin [Pseudobdellovibrionaceae bacterium]